MHVKWFLSQWIRVSQLASIFQDSLYIWNIHALTYDICFSLSDFTLSDRLYVHLELQTDIESRFVDTGQEREEGTNWDSSLAIYILPCVRLEKAMAPHSSTLVWKIPWTEEPDRLQSMGSQRVRHDWGTSLSLYTFMHWRRKWQPTPVFLPGESQGQGILVGCHLWGCTESDMTEAT